MTEPERRGAAWGPVTVLGAHILDVLGRPGRPDVFIEPAGGNDGTRP